MAPADVILEIEGPKELFHSEGERGGIIVVRVVDAAGVPVDARVGVANDELGAEITPLEVGATRIGRLPARPVELVATYAGRTFTKTVDPKTATDAVTIEVPEPLEILLRVAAHVSADTVLELSVRAADGRGGLHTPVHCLDGTWQPSSLQIYPGDYAVRCRGHARSPPWVTTWHIAPGEDGERWLMR